MNKQFVKQLLQWNKDNPNSTVNITVNVPPESKSLYSNFKELIFLILGLMISGITIYFTNFIKERSDDRTKAVTSMYDIHGHVINNLSRRLYLTFSMYKAFKRRDTTTTYKTEYLKLKEENSSERMIYQVKTFRFFNEGISDLYFSADSNIVEYGKAAEAAVRNDATLVQLQNADSIVPKNYGPILHRINDLSDTMFHLCVIKEGNKHVNKD